MLPRRGWLCLRWPTAHHAPRAAQRPAARRAGPRGAVLRFTARRPAVLIYTNPWEGIRTGTNRRERRRRARGRTRPLRWWRHLQTGEKEARRAIAQAKKARRGGGAAEGGRCGSALAQVFGAAPKRCAGPLPLLLGADPHAQPTGASERRPWRAGCTARYAWADRAALRTSIGRHLFDLRSEIIPHVAISFLITEDA